MAALLEFVVIGTPVSAQGGKTNLNKWKKAVRDQAWDLWRKDPTKQKLRSTMIHFHKGDTAPLDNDNMSKAVHDAMIKVVYVDDRQVIFTHAVQVNIDSDIRIHGASQLLLDSVAENKDFLYFRLDEIPDSISIPY
jgi:hypothetical protein